jgi:hypothetical protein
MHPFELPNDHGDTKSQENIRKEPEPLSYEWFKNHYAGVNEMSTDTKLLHTHFIRYVADIAARDAIPEENRQNILVCITDENGTYGDPVGVVHQWAGSEWKRIEFHRKDQGYPELGPLGLSAKYAQSLDILFMYPNELSQYKE